MIVNYKANFEREVVESKMKETGKDYRACRREFLQWKTKHLGEYNNMFRDYFNAHWIPEAQLEKK